MAIRPFEAPLQTLHRDVGPVGSAPTVAQPQVSALAASGTSAVFLVLTVDPSEAAAARVRDVCANMPAFVRSVGRRDPSGGLSCVVAIGAEAWEHVAPGRPRPWRNPRYLRSRLPARAPSSWS